MSNVVSMFPASGIEIAPAGYARLTLQWSTSDGNNLQVTYSITDGSHTYSVQSNANGYAEQLVAAGGTYTISVTHGGTYLGAKERKVTTESTKGYYIAWNAWVESGLQAMIQVHTDAGASVTATDQATSNVYSATADSSGIASVYGMQAGHTYTVTATKDYSVSATVTVEHLVQSVSLTGISAATLNVTTNAGATVSVKDKATAEIFTATASSVGTASLAVRLGRTYTVTVSLNGNSKSGEVTVSTSPTAYTLMHIIYTVKIARSTADDIARCTYADDCAGWTPFSRRSSNAEFSAGSWDGNALISGIKPIKRSGSTVTDLNKTTLSGYSTSTSADDFVRVPTWWLSITNTDDTITISFSDAQVNSTYQKYASTYKGADRGYFDFGMFHSIVSSSKLYSYSGATPTVSTSISDFITCAQARGSGYDIINYDEVTYLTALFILLFKRTNFQAAVGNGITSSSKTSTAAITSFSNNYGMYGDTSGKATTVCFFWIHDFIGNVHDFVGGAKTNSSRQLMRIIGADSSVTESDFTLQSDSPSLSSNMSGYVSDVIGSNGCGFFPKACSGSSTTFWCDNGYVVASYFPIWGGAWGNDTNAGPFYWNFYYSATGTDTYVGSRLSYRAPS